MGKAVRARVMRDFRQEEVREALCQEYARLLIAQGVIENEKEIKAGRDQRDAVRV